jgi:endonuclease YncB( thermonuclease family)
VIDGDTLAIGDTRIRLEGIDAPEAGQQCASAAGAAWPCGEEAARLLGELVRGRSVTCAQSGTDRYARVLAICRVGSLELNAEMVQRGLAWAFVRYSQRLVGIEAEARARRVGIWQAENEPAWSYRARRWSAAQDGAPRGCAIKGIVRGAIRTYYLPWTAGYDSIVIDAGRGERWFCSEADALAAGWHPAPAR